MTKLDADAGRWWEGRRVRRGSRTEMSTPISIAALTPRATFAKEGEAALTHHRRHFVSITNIIKETIKEVNAINCVLIPSLFVDPPI